MEVCYQQEYNSNIFSVIAHHIAIADEMTGHLAAIYIFKGLVGADVLVASLNANGIIEMLKALR